MAPKWDRAAHGDVRSEWDRFFRDAEMVVRRFGGEWRLCLCCGKWLNPGPCRDHIKKLKAWRDEESQYQILYWAAWSIHKRCKGREFDEVVAKLERICIQDALAIQNMHDAMNKCCEEMSIQWPPLRRLTSHRGFGRHGSLRLTSRRGFPFRKCDQCHRTFMALRGLGEDVPEHCQHCIQNYEIRVCICLCRVFPQADVCSRLMSFCSHPWYITGIVVTLRRFCFHQILSNVTDAGTVFDQLHKQDQLDRVLHCIMDLLVA